MSEAVDKVVLESYLKKLCLSSFIRNHEALASEAAQNNQSYTRYLLALAEQEVQEREARRRQRRLKEAKIPVLKEFSSFDFEEIPQLNQQKIRQLADSRSLYIKQKVEAAGGAEDSLDEKIYGAVREQAASRGLTYDSDSASY